MNLIFRLVANFLNKVAFLTGLTYNEINIIAYYLIIPLTWTVMADIIIGIPFFTPLLLLVWGYIYFTVTKKGRFREWCDRIFYISVQFLLFFRKIGWNYIVASVIICVVLPGIIYGFLIWGLVEKFSH